MLWLLYTTLKYNNMQRVMTTKMLPLMLAIIASIVISSTRAEDDVISVDTKGACSKPCKLFKYGQYLDCSACNCIAIPLMNMTDVLKLDGLTHVYLANNAISKLTKLPSMPQLEFLDLANNVITQLDGDLFLHSSSSKLRVLNLTNNFINTIDSTAFYGLNALQYLSLGDNSLKTLGNRVFWDVQATLTTLNLSSNSLTYLSPSIMDISTLEILHLEHNKLNKIERFWGMKGLHTIHLEDNELETIGYEFFDGCPNLKVVYLKNNRLTNITMETFYGLGLAEIVHLEDNIITSLPASVFKYMESVHSLYLDGNPVVEVAPGAFPANIQAISLTRTHTISVIHNNTFAGLPLLSKLFLNDNRILSSIEQDAFGGRESRIQSLDLSNNALTTLDPDLLDYSQLIFLDLEGNPWNCDCHLAWMTQINLKLSGEGLTAKCASPYHLKGALVVRTRFESFSCDVFTQYRSSMGLGLIALTTTVFIIVTACLVCKYRQRVLPCMYKDGKQYQALFNAKDLQQDDPAVSVQWQDGKESDRLQADGKGEAV